MYKKELIKKLFFILIGIIVFSPFLNYFTINILRTQHAYIELFLFPLFLIFRKKFSFKTIDIIVSLFFLLLFSLIGSLSEWFSLVQILDTTRSYLLLLLLFLVFKSCAIISVNDLYYLSFGTVLGALSVSLLNFNSVDILEGTGFSYIVDMNVIAIPICVSSVLLKKSKLVIILTFIVLFLACFLSTARGLVFFFFISLLFALFFIYNRRRDIVYFVIFSISVSLSGLFTVYYKFESFFMELSPTIHNRIYTKVKEGSSGDDVRLGHINYIFNNFDSYFIPRGFVSRKTGEIFNRRDLWMVQDIALGELLYTFGFVFIIFFVVFCVRYCNIVRRTNKTDSEILVLCVASSLFIFIFFGYGLLIYAYSVSFLGLFLAFFFYPKKLIS